MNIFGKEIKKQEQKITTKKSNFQRQLLQAEQTLPLASQGEPYTEPY
ncbi:hypothetical protein CSC26_4118 [Pseudomonas aeruginosa]|nr:hypothetical protein CSC26_4118 [Pseudomonas aeruginosa]